MRIRTLAAGLAGVCALAWCSFAPAAIVFSYGALTDLGSNTYSFPLLVRADASTSVRTFDLLQFIGDGGAAAGGSTTTPKFASLDVKPAGGLFAASSDSVTKPLDANQAKQYRLVLTAAPASVSIPTTATLFATVTVDTTGLAGNSFTLSNFFGASSSKFSSAPSGSNDLAVTNLSTTITVPEPATLGLAAIASAGLLTRRRRVA